MPVAKPLDYLAGMIFRIVVHHQDFPFDTFGKLRSSYTLKGHRESLAPIVGAQDDRDLHELVGKFFMTRSNASSRKAKEARVENILSYAARLKPPSSVSLV